ncbi:MAG: hypothetical protein J6D26_02425 [Clostridia bacterium]|nr:hypothetical protein [Clostridia bacterium]
MANLSCSCRSDCAGLAIVASLILGIVAAFLRITAVITVTPAFLWVVFGIAVVYLAVTLVTSAIVRSAGAYSCVCSVLPVLLTGILGSVLTAVILLAVTFVATSIIGAIITGALIFFFSLVITSAACLVKCVAGCRNNMD